MNNIKGLARRLELLTKAILYYVSRAGAGYSRILIKSIDSRPGEGSMEYIYSRGTYPISRNRISNIRGVDEF
jgi:hypothetical protein